MNSFTYENQGTNTYLVYHVGADETIDSLGLGMLTNNTIPGLAQTMCLQMNNDKFIKYNVSAKVSVRQFFTGPVNKARLLGVFNGIASAMIAAEDYMIDPDTILLDLDYIFADVSSCETVLVCLPIVDTERQHIDLGLFFKNIMFFTQFDQTENCDYVAKIMNHLNSMPIFSLTDFKKMIDGLMKNTALDSVISEKKAVEPVLQNYSQPPAPVAQESQPTKKQTYQQPVATQISQPSVQKPYTKPEEQRVSGRYESGVPISVTTPAADREDDVKPMSKLYLLQHYTKENKAIYEAQKASKKKGASVAGSPPKNKAYENKQKITIPGGKETPNVGFAIPGQSAPQNTPISKTNAQQPAVRPIRIQDPPKDQPVAESVPVQKSDVISVSAQPAYVPPTPVASGNFGETVVLNGGMSADTVVLNAGMLENKVASPYLIRRKNNERIPINKPAFRIGKEKSYVDYFIGDNSAISRSHANILTRDGRYYVVDTNSTNHTYLDGSILKSNSEYEIVHGSKLRFANEDFEFLLF